MIELSTVSEAQSDQSSAQAVSGVNERPEFKLQIHREILNAWLIALATLVDEGILSVSKKGIEARVVDSAHVAMIESRLKRKAFDSIKVSKPGRFGIDIDKLIEKLRVVPKDALITLTIERGRLYIQYQAGKFTQSLVAVEGISDPKIPAVILQGKIKLAFDTMLMLFEPFKKMDYVKLMLKEEKFIVLGQLTDSEMVFYGECPHKELIYVRGKTLKLASLFPMDYLAEAIKNSQKGGFHKLFKDQEIEINLGRDNPLSIQMDTDEVEFQFMLAPRIEADSW